MLYTYAIYHLKPNDLHYKNTFDQKLTLCMALFMFCLQNLNQTISRKYYIFH